MKKIVIALVGILLFASCASTTTNIILLPDTQTYAEKYPEVLESQINWIVKEQRNIDFILQQGDLTQNNNEKEWKVVKDAFDKLRGIKTVVLAAGNHDMGSADGKFADVRNTMMFNQFFPPTYFSKQKNFGGTFEEGKSENIYFLINSGKIKWLIISLEFGPRNSVIQWANSIAKKYADRIVILNTHSYMYSDNTRQGIGDNWRPQSYGVGKDVGENAVNDGDQIWDKFVRINPNVRFVFSGHILNQGVGTLISENNNGALVYQMLANYQEGVKGSVKGGNGWLRMISIDTKTKKITVKTYSPFLNEFMTTSAHRFEFNNFKR
ncbi:MAG: metallophosphatase [Sphingobacteriales bacterium]|nr:MAG: metallophosphatase [Sphingobacteriales bacterium]